MVKIQKENGQNSINLYTFFFVLTLYWSKPKHTDSTKIETTYQAQTYQLIKPMRMKGTQTDNDVNF